jgi:hypothetical protein
MKEKFESKQRRGFANSQCETENAKRGGTN